MDGIFDLLLVALFVLGIVSKSQKKKKAAEAKSASAPARAPEQTAEPAPSTTPPRNPQIVNRQNVESMVKAFSELTERMETAKKPTVEAIAAQKKQQKTAIEAETAMNDRAEIIKARIQESLSGQSATDDHGCIGGSMPDHNAEGESRAEHAAHEENRRKRLAEEAAIRAKSLRKPTAADLRRAVVMSEILDKPVALRGRRT